MIRKIHESVAQIEVSCLLIFGIHHNGQRRDVPAVQESLFQCSHEQDFPKTRSLKLFASRQSPQQSRWQLVVLRKAQALNHFLRQFAGFDCVLGKCVVTGDRFSVRRENIDGGHSLLYFLASLFL